MAISVAQLASYLSAAFALVAAGFWLVSALVKTPSGFAIVVFLTHVDALGGVGQGSSQELNNLANSLRRQSRWSARAAISAAVSAVLQAVATYLPACVCSG
jgi:hypothetical protein